VAINVNVLFQDPSITSSNPNTSTLLIVESTIY